MHVTPDGLDAVMKDWDADGELVPHMHYASLAAFVRICDELEPHLSPGTLAPRLAEWIAALRKGAEAACDNRHKESLQELGCENR